jgi:hypothetical protein
MRGSAAQPTRHRGAKVLSSQLAPSNYGEDTMLAFRRGVLGIVSTMAFGLPALGAGVEVVFDLSQPSQGPFPSDRFTLPDDPGDPNNTGLRVNMPKPDCKVRPTDCNAMNLLNDLDGFNLLPRLSIPFTGAIDVRSVSSRSVFLVRLGTAVRRPEKDDEDGEEESEKRGGGVKIVGINRVVWDPATATLHAQSDEFLEQYTRYLLVVTRAVRDVPGNPIEVSAQFDRFRRDDNFGKTGDPVLKTYRKSLLRALSFAEDELDVHRKDIAAASVFTTQTVTSVMERIRDAIKGSMPAPANFCVANDPQGAPIRAAFTLSAVMNFLFREHVGFTKAPAPLGPRFTDVDRTAALSLLRIFDGAVGQIAFGKFSSPDYLGSDGVMPRVGTLASVPPVQRVNELHFTLLVPSGPRPAKGWPVALFGHGLGQHDKNISPFAVASTLAAHGIAVIGINFVGHGFGPLGTLAITLAPSTVATPCGATAATPGTVTVPAGGRGQDRNGDGIIGAQEGFNVVPLTLIVGRDSRRQSAIDLMQLVRVVQVGVDVDGDGAPDLDPSRIYYLGFSLGASAGIMAVALDPDIQAAALSSLNGLIYEEFRLGTVFRPQTGASLAARNPSLFNNPSASCPGAGCAAFDENIPFRDQPAVTKSVAGAMEIQEVLDWGEWISMQATPIGFAVHLRKHPLDGVRRRPVIVQFSKGDETAPNPSTSALLRAADLTDQATFFRNDLAFKAPPCNDGAGKPCVDKSPHRLLVRTDSPAGSPNFLAALQAQEQVGTFFASQGATVIDPDGPAGPLFEVPIQGPLPEDLSFIP